MALEIEVDVTGYLTKKPDNSFLRDVAVQAALQAGRLLSQGFGTSFSIETKGGSYQNLVTAYDRASETMIIDMIKRKVPSSSFLAEESGRSKEKGQAVLWIIDPLDGTTNFSRNIPFFSVSIAASVDGVVVAGVVFNPMLSELFVAEKDKGSTLNGKRLHVSKTSTKEKALLCTGFPIDTADNPLGTIDTIQRVLSEGYPLRRMGSAAIDLSYVAAGRYDAFWEACLAPWDVAAGVLILEEAGGKATDYFDNPINMNESGSVLASNGLMHPLMLELLRPT